MPVKLSSHFRIGQRVSTVLDQHRIMDEDKRYTGTIMGIYKMLDGFRFEIERDDLVGGVGTNNTWQIWVSDDTKDFITLIGDVEWDSEDNL